MLAKAVKRHVPSHDSKGPASQQAKVAANTLQPCSSTVLNAPRPGWPIVKNPLKRTASQAMGVYKSRDMETSLNREAGLSRHDAMQTKGSNPPLSQESAGGGRVSKLHNTVFFDENDFDDDADIDLNSDSTSSKTLEGWTEVSYPTLPQSSASVRPAQPKSSAPIPWSSSPLHHKFSPDKPSALSPAALAGQTGVPAPKATKRSSLPWSTITSGESHDQKSDPPANKSDLSAHKSDLPAQVKQMNALARQRHSTANVQGTAVGKGSFTPLPKDKPNSPYPWNKTTSAVKKEQKALRDAHKKLVKNGIKDADGDEPGKITSAKAKKVHRVFLSDEQRNVLDLVADARKSVFFTGSAGTGKSVLLREIIRALRQKHKHEIDRVAVTASTGLAACNVGGVTLHSFAGIGLGKEAVPELVRKIKRNAKAKLRWMRTKILIIDEISMVDGDLFDKLEGIARIIRNNGRPFGGIQLVITGDFFQLPPVPDYGKVSTFAFDAATWNTSIEHTIALTQVFRQKDPGMCGLRA